MSEPYTIRYVNFSPDSFALTAVDAVELILLKMTPKSSVIMHMRVTVGSQLMCQCYWELLLGAVFMSFRTRHRFLFSLSFVHNNVKLTCRTKRAPFPLYTTIYLFCPSPDTATGGWRWLGWRVMSRLLKGCCVDWVMSLIILVRRTCLCGIHQTSS